MICHSIINLPALTAIDARSTNFREKNGTMKSNNSAQKGNEQLRCSINRDEDNKHEEQYVKISCGQFHSKITFNRTQT